MTALEGSRWARTLTSRTFNPLLDMADYVGQRSASYTFTLVDSLTGYSRTVNPINSGITPTLTHDTGRTIKRQLNNFFLSVADTDGFSEITSRLDVTMVIDDVSYPLGRYMPANWLQFPSTAGVQSSPSFYDEGFIVDQETRFSVGSTFNSSSYESARSVLVRFLNEFPITYSIEPSEQSAVVGWPMGVRGGYIVDQLALDGDWFSPWFDHTNVMRFIRTFDPATAIPTFDMDSGNKILRSKISESSDLITAPNRFVVVSNGVSASGDNSISATGTYDVPSSAPHSIANRGFIVQKTFNRQVTSASQAAAVARAIGQQFTVFETAELTTAPDPRHDSYDVIRWQDDNWLEISWSLQLAEGGQMTHTMRKAYTSD